MQQDPRCFYQQLEVKFYECDRHKRTRIETIMRMMADVAGVAYTAKGYSHTWLWERHSVFLVTRAAIRIRRMPQMGETIWAKTWENDLKGSQYYRDVVLTDGEGNPLVEGQTAWVVVDPETRAIQRPRDFPGEFHPYPELKADTLSPDRLSLPEEMEVCGRRLIVYSDIDGNDHTYNAAYVGIACDFLPPEWMERPLRDFRVNFKREARLGETLEIRSHLEGDIAVVAGFLDRDLSFVCEFRF